MGEWRAASGGQSNGGARPKQPSGSPPTARADHSTYRGIRARSAAPRVLDAPRRLAPLPPARGGDGRRGEGQRRVVEAPDPWHDHAGVRGSRHLRTRQLDLRSAGPHALERRRAAAAAGGLWGGRGGWWWWPAKWPPDRNFWRSEVELGAGRTFWSRPRRPLQPAGAVVRPKRPRACWVPSARAFAADYEKPLLIG